jgi:hypothetical protein
MVGLQHLVNPSVLYCNMLKENASIIYCVGLVVQCTQISNVGYGGKIDKCTPFLAVPVVRVAVNVEYSVLIIRSGFVSDLISTMMSQHWEETGRPLNFDHPSREH